ncbi:hypothetical protein [Streptomyces sp.]|uniref:hypothetical protein n=1 Tax=Streptomyces sp. TaxID=1931 RepID=UPI002D4093A7|nr:hypothetical protein [Streptomyces sp.]HZF89435.1 hypothetical protein [Streptomyces sp.]
MTMTSVPQRPPHPPRARRGPALASTLIVTLVLALAGGGYAAWRTLHGEDEPLAGRPRVDDTTAGLSYAVPEGWQRGDGDLISSFTSSLTHEHPGAEGGSVVLAGRGDAVPRSELGPSAERWARSNAVFFHPEGRSAVTESEATTVDGRPAHTVTLKVTDGENGTGRLRMTLIAVSDDRTAFLLSVVQPATEAEKRTADLVLRSAALL